MVTRFREGCSSRDTLRIPRRDVTSIAKKLLLGSRRASRLFDVDFFESLEPEFLWIETTNQCASRCASCSIWRNAPTEDLLTPPEVENALRDPIFRRLKIVVVSGGEPTLRSDIEAILCAIHRAAPKANIVLSSNAMLPERLLCVVKSALDQGIALEVGVSLDGVGASHDRARGVPGLFQKADHALRELVKLRRIYGAMLRVKAGFTLSDATVSQTESVRRYAKELGIAFNVQWYNQAKYYANVGKDLLSKRIELERAARRLRPTLVNALGRRALRREPLTFACSSMFNFCLLKSNGDVVPCFRLWDVVVGNIRSEKPSAIWRNTEARRARRSVRDCQGCLNTCGVLWSYDVNYLGRVAFYLTHPDALLERLEWTLRNPPVRCVSRT